jgi:hypothetical protein
MKTIPLHPLHHHISAFVDDADYERLKDFHWQLVKNDSGQFYARRNVITLTGQSSSVHMHQDVLGQREGMIIDHRSGLGLDNRKTNLRFVTHRQNSHNKLSENATGFRGVSAVSPHKFRCCIGGVDLGIYRTAESAAGVYNWAAVRMRGEFAVLNAISGIIITPTPPAAAIILKLEAQVDFVTDEASPLDPALSADSSNRVHQIHHGPLRLQQPMPALNILRQSGRANLVKRGRIWYWRKMVRGVVTSISLGTGDLKTAQALANPAALLASKRQAVQRQKDLMRRVESMRI